jgi:hypothetical protein
MVNPYDVIHGRRLNKVRLTYTPVDNRVYHAP